MTVIGRPRRKSHRTLVAVAAALTVTMLATSCSVPTADSEVPQPQSSALAGGVQASGVSFEVPASSFQEPAGGWLTPYVDPQVSAIIGDIAAGGIDKLSELAGKFIPVFGEVVTSGILNLLMLGLFGPTPTEGAENAKHFREINKKIAQIDSEVKSMTNAADANFAKINARIDQLNISDASRGVFTDTNTAIGNAMLYAGEAAAATAKYADAKDAKSDVNMKEAVVSLQAANADYLAQADKFDSATITQYLKALLGDNSQGVWQLQNQAMRTQLPIQTYESSLILQQMWTVHMTRVGFLLDAYVANQAKKSAALQKIALTRRAKIIGSMKDMYPQTVPPGTLFDTATGKWITTSTPTKWASFPTSITYPMYPSVDSKVDCRTSVQKECNLDADWKMFMQTELTSGKTYMGVADSKSEEQKAVQQKFKGLDVKAVTSASHDSAPWLTLYNTYKGPNHDLNVADGMRSKAFVTDKDKETNALFERIKTSNILSFAGEVRTNYRPYYVTSSSIPGLCAQDLKDFCFKTSEQDRYRTRQDWAQQDFYMLVPSGRGDQRITRCPTQTAYISQWDKTNGAQFTLVNKAPSGNLSFGPACDHADEIAKQGPGSLWTQPSVFGIELNSPDGKAASNINPIREAHYSFSMPNPNAS